MKTECVICRNKRAAGKEMEWLWVYNDTRPAISVGFLCVQCSPPGNLVGSLRIAEKFGNDIEYAASKMAHFERKNRETGHFQLRKYYDGIMESAYSEKFP